MTTGRRPVGCEGRAARRTARVLAGPALALVLLVPAASAASGRAAVPSLPTALAECARDRPQSIAAPPSALGRLGAADAWQRATGAGVVVAVVDSGVDPGNAHLTGALLPGVDLVGLEGDPTGWSDPAGHGTAVAGQVAARPVTGSGLVGLAPQAMVLPVRVYYEMGDRAVEDGVAPRTDRMAQGIRYAAEQGAQIINVSLSSPADDPALREAVQLATELGSLVVASGGNRNTTQDTRDSPRYPAAYDEVLAVAAVDAGDAVTEDSIHGAHIDVAAPGTDVLTTFHAAGDCVLAGGEASPSYATAYVSAAAALVAQAYPEETPAQWAYRLEVTAARPVAGARDDLAGWGVIRPAAALAFVDDGSAPGPASPVHERPVVTSAEPATLELGAQEDVLAPVRAVSAWWVVGGVAACVGAVLASQIPPRRRSGRVVPEEIPR